MLLPIDLKKERVTGILCDLRNEKVMVERGYKGTYKDSFKEVWESFMSERQKQGYSFEQIYEYMINS